MAAAGGFRHAGSGAAFTRVVSIRCGFYSHTWFSHCHDLRLGLRNDPGRTEKRKNRRSRPICRRGNRAKTEPGDHRLAGRCTRVFCLGQVCCRFARRGCADCNGYRATQAKIHRRDTVQKSQRQRGKRGLLLGRYPRRVADQSVENQSPESHLADLGHGLPRHDQEPAPDREGARRCQYSRRRRAASRRYGAHQCPVNRYGHRCTPVGKCL